MFAAIRKWFRSDDEVIADAEREAEGLAGPLPLVHLRVRHGVLLERLVAKGMDQNTVLLLIQLFGPLLVKLLERWLALHTNS